MSWGDFKPLLADAVKCLTSVLQCSMYRLASFPIVRAYDFLLSALFNWSHDLGWLSFSSPCLWSLSTVFCDGWQAYKRL